MLICFVLLFAGSLLASPNFNVDNFEEWEEMLQALPDLNKVVPMSLADWDRHMEPWLMHPSEIEGLPYLNGDDPVFVPCELPDGELYVHDGSDYPDSGDDEGLVMRWETEGKPDGNYASGWKMVYGVDPDLSNSLVQVTANPPAPHSSAPLGTGITAISFAFVDVNGNRRVWWWSVPSIIPYGQPTTVKIDGSKTGVNATSPVASGYSQAPGFDITQVVSFDVDENFNYNFQQAMVPPPGQPQFMSAWNYWHNLLVTNKNTQAYKWFFKKFSQPPFVIGETDPPQILGWDQVSWLNDIDGQVGTFVMAADDWVCSDPRPVTDVHWWGSFEGWTQPDMPLIVPDYFLMAIWTDSQTSIIHSGYSQPVECVWTHKCYNWVWNFAGYDEDPRCLYPDICMSYPEICRPNNTSCLENEACFQFNQLLSEDDWFWQDPLDGERIYWLSIAAVYENRTIDQIPHPWGWKTKPHEFKDVAVLIDDVNGLPINAGNVVNSFWPLVLPSIQEPQEAFDLAFELSTNDKEPDKCYDDEGDINHDCIVNIVDFRLLAEDWLNVSVP
jgi:hypothetical protein